jgi:hypothetical protein
MKTLLHLCPCSLALHVAVPKLAPKPLGIWPFRKMNALQAAPVCTVAMPSSRSFIATVLLSIGLSATVSLAQPVDTFDRIQTTTGKVFRNVEVLAVDPDGLRLRHDDGVSKVPFADLPSSLTKQYPYDPQKAAEFAAQTEATNRKAIQFAEDERARAEYDELCRRAGLPPGFYIPTQGPLTVEQVKGRWLLDNAARPPAFGDPDRVARESAAEYRKSMILSGSLDREAEKIALRHNLDWYLSHDEVPKAEVARKRLADMQEEESKHAEIAVLERLAGSLSEIAAESTYRSDITAELTRIRCEMERLHLPHIHTGHGHGPHGHGHSHGGGMKIQITKPY